MRGRTVATLLAAALLAAGCVARGPIESSVPATLEKVRDALLPRPDAPEPVRFLAWGDAGHGSGQQRETADAAARVCAAEGCDLVLGLGDNVYPEGVASVDDPQLVEKFEAPNANVSAPFYMVLGNHDVQGSAEAQVDYTNVSPKWRMPARSYAVEEGDVAFYALDLTALDRGDANGSAELAAWLDEAWAASDATWRVAFAHFPYASSGQHGDAAGPLRAFLDAHVCGRADLYLAGHDHHLEWLDEGAGCAGTELVVSGAASIPRGAGERAAPHRFAAFGTPGFFWFEADGDRLTGRAYDDEGNVLYERFVVKEARAGAASTLPPPGGGP